MEPTAVITGASEALDRRWSVCLRRRDIGCLRLFFPSGVAGSFDGAAMLPGLSGGGLPGGFVLVLAGRRLCQSFGPLRWTCRRAGQQCGRSTAKAVFRTLPIQIGGMSWGEPGRRVLRDTFVSSRHDPPKADGLSISRLYGAFAALL